VFLKSHRDQLPVAVDLQAFRTYLKRPALQKTTSAAAAAEKPSVGGGAATKKPVTKDAKPNKDKSTTQNVLGANNRVDQVRMSVRQLLRDALTERYKNIIERLVLWIWKISSFSVFIFMVLIWKSNG